MPPEISIIIPLYNSEDFVEQTLKSAVDQTLSENQFEVIMVDDKSKDHTPDIAQTFANKYKNFYMYYNNANQGISLTTNIAIEKSHGRLITLLDGDDVLKPVALESTLAFMKSNRNVRYSYSGYDKIDSNGSKIGQVASLPFDKELLLHQDFVGHLKCFYRYLHNTIQGFRNGNHVQDWDHVLKASEILTKGQMERNPEVLYDYRIHPNNTSKLRVKQLRQSACKTIKGVLKRKGITANVYWSHMATNPDGSKHNYYDWREISVAISKAIPVAIPA